MKKRDLKMLTRLSFFTTESLSDLKKQWHELTPHGKAKSRVSVAAFLATQEAKGLGGTRRGNRGSRIPTYRVPYPTEP